MTGVALRLVRGGARADGWVGGGAGFDVRIGNVYFGPSAAILGLPTYRAPRDSMAITTTLRVGASL